VLCSWRGGIGCTLIAALVLLDILLLLLPPMLLEGQLHWG
jgi:hypothetical protein